jgi:homoserine kinase
MTRERDSARKFPRKITVRVPASTANLGPGFDALGLALRLYDVVEVWPAESGVSVEVLDAGAGDVQTIPTDETHLVVRALRHACARWDIDPAGLRLRCHNAIPHGRGLGSSAAAVVSGIAAGYALAGKELDDAALRLAVDFEGHADNAAASLYGGLAITWSQSGEFHSSRVVLGDGIRPIVAIPEVRSLTAVTRGLLPETISHTDAAFNAGRAALLVRALMATPVRSDLLLSATADRLHQDYRIPAMPESGNLVRRLRAHGVAAAISGAGPSVLALTTNGKLPPEVTTDAFTVVELGVDDEGVQVTVER